MCAQRSCVKRTLTHAAAAQEQLRALHRVVRTQRELVAALEQAPPSLSLPQEPPPAAAAVVDVLEHALQVIAAAGGAGLMPDPDMDDEVAFVGDVLYVAPEEEDDDAADAGDDTSPRA